MVVRVGQVLLFVLVAAGMTWAIAHGGMVSATFGFGWQAATGVFVLGAAALVASAGMGVLKAWVQGWVWMKRREKIKAARPKRVKMARFDDAVLPVVKKARRLQREIVTGAPLLGERLDAVGCFRSDLLALSEEERGALEQRGVDPALTVRRIDEALQGRGVLAELLEIDRILWTLQAALATEVSSVPYRS